MAIGETHSDALIFFITPAISNFYNSLDTLSWTVNGKRWSLCCTGLTDVHVSNLWIKSFTCPSPSLKGCGNISCYHWGFCRPLTGSLWHACLSMSSIICKSLRSSSPARGLPDATWNALVVCLVPKNTSIVNIPYTLIRPLEQFLSFRLECSSLMCRKWHPWVQQIWWILVNLCPPVSWLQCRRWASHTTGYPKLLEYLSIFWRLWKPGSSL